LVAAIAALAPALSANFPAGARSVPVERASSPAAVARAAAGDGPLRPKRTRAVSTDEFLDSLGVNTHVDQGYDAAKYVEPLIYAGIRNIRDGERNLKSYAMLHEATGIRVDLLGGTDLDGFLAAARSLASSDALLSLEGPNEPNNFPVAYRGQKGGGVCPACTWVPVAQFQRDLYGAVKRDSLLRRYPVFAASEAGAETDNVGLQFLTVPEDADAKLPAGTSFADYANLHNYVSGTAKTIEDNQAWKAADPVLNAHWDGLYGEYGLTWNKHFPGYSGEALETLPRVTSETGWDSVRDPGGERAQGTILVNTYLAQFKRGWRYTFLYELVDGQGGAGCQGLFRSDFTAKPAATFIHNLTLVLSRDNLDGEAGSLSYVVPDQPGTMHDLLLQKSPGTFDLIIWDERVNAADDVSVRFGTRHRSIDVYDVTQGSAPVRSLSDADAVPLTLSDHAVILEITD
jgi:hypothetical protein